jgi:hypothetical protein
VAFQLSNCGGASKAGFSGKARLVDRREIARPGQVALDDAGHPSAEIALADELGHRDRNRLEVAAPDVDDEFGPSGRDEAWPGECESQSGEGEAEIMSHHLGAVGVLTGTSPATTSLRMGLVSQDRADRN